MLPVTAFGRPEDDPELMLSIDEVWTDGRSGHIHVIFSARDAKDRDAFDFVDSVIGALACGWSSHSGYDFHVSISAVNGEHITVTTAKKLIQLLRLCGVAVITPPRIVNESFEGRFYGDPEVSRPRAYGQMLFEDVLGAS